MSVLPVTRITDAFSHNGRLLLVYLLGFLSAEITVQLDWTPGAASLIILAVPVWTLALSGQRVTAWFASICACLSCIGSSYYSHWHNDTPYENSFALFSAAVFLSVTWAILHTLESWQKRFQLSLEEKEREKSELREEIAEMETRFLSLSGLRDERENSIDFAMLLLTMQELGRRISANMDLESLIPTIITEAKSALKCEVCEIYLWDSKTGELKPPAGSAFASYNLQPRSRVINWIWEERRVLTRDRIMNDDWFAQCRGRSLWPYAMAPLFLGQERLGVLLIDSVPNPSPNLMRVLYVLANLSSLGIRNAQLFERIRQMARRDGLTGLLNHASFHQELRDLAVEFSLTQQPVTLIMSDIDHFKRFNDTHGHQAGDHVLREVARLWMAILPDHAILGRYGGEEFVCLLPNEDLERGRDLAELLREQIANHVVDFEGDQLHVTASFGVAELGNPAETSQMLVRLADEALYCAKERGRNLVVTATPGESHQSSDQEPQEPSDSDSPNPPIPKVDSLNGPF